MLNKLDSKILVTGGSGFIGSYMVKKLKKCGYTDITIIDVVPPKFNNIKYVKADFNDTKVISNLLKNVQYVFHFAAMIGVDNCRLHPDDVNTVNSINTKNFIDLCVKNGVNRFIFSSSSEIYGNSKDLPYKEDGVPEPISVYAKCKVEIENYLKKISETSNMTIGIVRFFNIYGSGQKKDFVIPIFIEQALKDLPLRILGDGLQTRCFTYIEDAVEGVYQVFRHTSSKYDIFNIGNPTEYNINQVAKLVLEVIFQSKSKIIHRNYGNEIRDASYEILRRVPSTDKARNILGFIAKTPLKDGIKQVVSMTVSE